MGKDRRYLPQQISEVRAISNEDGAKHIIGKGIVFNQRSRKMGWFVEIINSDALRTANMEEMKAFFNHNADYTLGSLRNKTIELSITEDAASYDILAPETQTIRDLVLAPIERGDVDGSSFMFDIEKDEWEEESDGIYVRNVDKISVVYEMGPVSMPAYLQSTTDVAKRSFDEFIKKTREDEREAKHYRRLHAERRMKLFAGF